MASYIINSIDGENVNLTVKIDDHEFIQDLCGMPMNDIKVLKSKLEEYVADYEQEYTNPPVKAKLITEVDALIGKEIVVESVATIELKPQGGI